MNMHDKDMDALFRSKLADLEVEPSPIVWANINNQLGTQNKRKSYVPLLKIAASVAILVTAGMIFLTNKDVIKPTNPLAINSGVKTPKIVTPETQPVKQADPIKEEPQITTAQPTQRIAQVVVVRHTVTSTPTGATNTTQPTVESVKPATIVDTPPNSLMVSTNKTNVVVPDITFKTADTAPQSKTVLAANDEPVTDNITSAPVKKRKIHGLGGFINAVVGAVDKRDDKIIEFTETDEGDAVTGINLGLFRVKKQK